MLTFLQGDNRTRPSVTTDVIVTASHTLQRQQRVMLQFTTVDEFGSKGGQSVYRHQRYPSAPPDGRVAPAPYLDTRLLLTHDLLARQHRVMLQ